jgi:nucleoside-diphosphate-sugar epimerase
VVPVRRDVRLDLVPVDFVADAITALSGDIRNIGGRFHLAAGPEGDISLGRLVDLVQRIFERKVRVLPIPVWKAVVRPLVRVAQREFFERAQPVFTAFESYLWEAGSRFDTSRTRRALAGTGVDLPQTEPFVEASLRYARASNFGERQPDAA